MNKQAVIERLSKSLTYKTISFNNIDKIDYREFELFKDFIENSFVLVHKNLKRTPINNYSIVYKWSSNKDNNKLPVLLLAHYDVVPANDEIDGWSYPPFSGKIAEGYIWGRGAIDNKGSLLGLLEAVESLLEQGFTPDRDIYFAFGHDEEIGGYSGAKQIAKYFHEKKIRFDFALDEGLLVTEGVISGTNKPVAMIGLAEKGYVTIKVTANGSGGHSSMPPENTSVFILSKALMIIEKNPFKLKMHSVIKTFISNISGSMSFIIRIILKNLWLTEGLVKKIFAKKHTTNAFIRTTVAPTMLSASIKDNILPENASVTLNIRILPGETIESVVRHIKTILKKLPVDVHIVDGPNCNPSKVSSDKSLGYKSLVSCTNAIYPNAIVAPSITLAGTDSKHYTDLCNDNYRFIPISITGDEAQKIHGIDERITEDNYINMIKFYKKLMELL